MIYPVIYGIVTLILIFAFIVLCFWAYSPRRHKEFEEQSRIPLMGDALNKDNCNKDEAK